MLVTRTLFALLSIVVAAGLVAACDDDGGEDVTSAGTPASGGADPAAGEGEVCGALDDFRSSIATLTQSANADELQDNAESARERAQDLRDAVTDAGLDGMDQIEDSLDEFSSDVEDASSGDQPLAEIVSVVGAAIVKVQDQLTDVRVEGGCD
jgi:hypothetical protein